MPARTTRVTRKREASRAPQVNFVSNQTEDILESHVPEEDYDKMSAKQLMDMISMHAKSQFIDKLLGILTQKIKSDFAEQLEADKRGRSIVISGLPESTDGSNQTEPIRELENKVYNVLDALNVRGRPMDFYRMGKINSSRPRLVKVVFPSAYYWRRALANAHLLRSAGFPDVYVRRSMTSEERNRECELRQEARRRNTGKPQREWVVYRGELMRASDINRNRSGNS